MSPSAESGNSKRSRTTLVLLAAFEWSWPKPARRANHLRAPALCPVPVQPSFQKYFPFAVGQIISRDSSHPGLHKGRFAVVTKRWARDAVDVATSTDDDVGSRTAKACGPDASTLASTRRQCLRIALGTVARKPDSPGRARHRPLKPFACGNAGLLWRTRGDFACVLFIFAREAAGAFGARHSPRPFGGR